MKVLFCHTESGWPGQRVEAIRYAKPGHIYTVRDVEVGQSSTRITLEEFPGVDFNSVMFTPWPGRELQSD